MGREWQGPQCALRQELLNASLVPVDGRRAGADKSLAKRVQRGATALSARGPDPEEFIEEAGAARRLASTGTDRGQVQFAAGLTHQVV